MDFLNLKQKTYHDPILKLTRSTFCRPLVYMLSNASLACHRSSIANRPNGVGKVRSRFTNRLYRQRPPSPPSTPTPPRVSGQLHSTVSSSSRASVGMTPANSAAVYETKPKQCVNRNRRNDANDEFATAA